MFNIVQKSNSKLVQSFSSADEANAALLAMGPRRNFLKIVEDKPTVVGVGRLATLKDIVSHAQDGLTMAEIKDAYFLKTGLERTKKEVKKVYETIFQHSDVCHNKDVNPDKAIFTRDEDGKYRSK